MRRVAITAVTTAEQHVRRLAHKSPDNPFLRRVACQSLTADERATLVDLMSRKQLSDAAAQRIFEGQFGFPTVGIVPRDLGQGKTTTESTLAATSLNAFADMPLPWWIISHLWCQEVGRAVDALLPVGLMGDRLHSRYRTLPRANGQMFRSTGEVETELGRVVTKAVESSETPVSAVVFDLKSFFYSVTSSPTEILSAAGLDWVLRPLGRRLTAVLDLLHERFAVELGRLAPRGDGPEVGSQPLPVGLPSSRVLSNAIVMMVVRDLSAIRGCVAAGAFVDDLVVVTGELPTPQDHPDAFLEQQGLIEADESSSLRLRSPRGAAVARMVLSPGKSRFVWGRVIRQEDLAIDEPGPGDAESQPEHEPDVDSDDDAEVGPYPPEDAPEDDKLPRSLLSVIEVPPPPPRVPRPLRNDLKRLTDEIRVGIDAAAATASLQRVVKIDSLTRLRLRPYWDEFLACTYYAEGAEAFVGLVASLSATIDSLAPPAGAGDALTDAMRAGLRYSLIQATVEALAAAVGRKSPLKEMDKDRVCAALGISALRVSRLTRSVRRARFVKAEFVSAPLAEYTDWQGPVFGDDAYRRFSRWATDRGPELVAAQLAAGVADANRFVKLHEVCMAVHLWMPAMPWQRKVFELFGTQPLLDRAVITDLRKRVRAALNATPVETAAPTSLRFAVPSLGVAEEQLDWLVKGKRSKTSKVARASRRTVMRTMLDAARQNADAIVYPEWSLPARQLPWIFETSSRAQILVVGGEQPRISTGGYSNRIWTGIPLVDAHGHNLCLVPPPREKRYLSAQEDHDRKEKAHTPSHGNVPVYQWRGIRIASLICFEFADAQVRSALRTVVDVLTVSSLNRDWKYFQAIQEATTRDNYCVTVCVNTSQYPGTHLMRPVSSEKAIALSLHGATDAAVVIKEVDPSPVVLARRTGKSPRDRTFPGDTPTDGLTLADYKPLPPSFR